MGRERTEKVRREEGRWRRRWRVGRDMVVNWGEMEVVVGGCVEYLEIDGTVRG